MKPAAVLFDLDGTLTDSTRVFHRAVEESLAELGGTLSRDIFDPWHTVQGKWSDLLERHDLDPALHDRMHTLTYEAFDRLLKTDIEWIDGAAEAVAAVRERGCKTAIVTNSIHRFVDTLNTKLPLRAQFPVVITEDETKERRKPDPYGPLLAADLLGVKPDECLFVGDQTFDMLAANAAGMESCLYLGAHTPPETALLAKRVIRSMRELSSVLD